MIYATLEVKVLVKTNDELIALRNKLVTGNKDIYSAEIVHEEAA